MFYLFGVVKSCDQEHVIINQYNRYAIAKKMQLHYVLQKNCNLYHDCSFSAMIPHRKKW